MKKLSAFFFSITFLYFHNKPNLYFRACFNLLAILCITGICTQSTAQTSVPFTANGTWVCPAGVTTISVECWGAGGGGGGSANSNNNAGGGGGGGAYVKKAVSVTAGTTYNITIGVGGPAGASATNGTSGGNTVAVFGATTITALGGHFGYTGGSGAGGAGGVASGGDVNYNGGQGAAGVNTSAAGGGGGGAGSTGVGNDAVNGTGGLAKLDHGGVGGSSSAEAGGNYGAGGAGGYGKGKAGGAGAPGYAIITYTCPTYSLTNTSGSSPVNAGSTSTVTLTSSAAGLPVGTYTVTYNLSAPNAATGLTATMTVSSAGTGTFTTAVLANAGATTVTITKLASGSPTGCSATISSNNTSVITVNAALSYCANTNTISTSYYINDFSTTGGTANITNNASGFSTNGYGDFTSKIVSGIQGTSTINFSITEVGGTMHFGIWVDWNQDGDFVDAGEEVYINNTSYLTTATGSFTVPAGATLGSTRMRVVGNEYGTVAACTGTEYTECEDYTITVIAAAPMAFSSCTTTQGNTSGVALGTTDNEIIGIQIVTTGSSSPLSVTSFTVNANGSTNISDINTNNTAKIYYTGTSSTFATTTLFGSNTPTIANFNITGTQTLSSGTNYFWLVYSVKAGATVGDVVDGECTSLTVGTAKIPTVTAPAGNRPIINQVTIGAGTSTGSYPFYTYYGYTRSASLFTAAEVGVPAVITQLAWNISTAQTANIPVKIYLKTTISTTLSSDTWANMISGATLVYDATTSFTPTGWKTFNITDFVYCTDNLLVLCEANYGGAGTTSPSFYYTSATNQHETWSQDDTPPSGSGSVGSSRPNIRIDKSASTACSGTPTAGTVAASVNPICAPASTTLTVSGSSTDCGLTYQWQSSLDNSSWANIIGATYTSYIASPAANTYYRRQVTCGVNTTSTPGYLVSLSNAVPTCATAQLPANNATGECLPVTLSWTAPVNAGCNAVTGYDVYLDTFTPPTTLVSSNQAGTSYVATGLAGNTAYYWRVVPRNAVGPATGCSNLKFTTAAQTYATLPYSTSFESAWVAKCGTADVAPDQYWNGTPLSGNNSWRRDDVITSSGQYTPASSDLTYSAEFDAYNASSGTTGALDLYVNMSPAGTKTLFFDYINPGTSTANDKMDVKLSTDGGTSFTTLLTLTNEPGWVTKSLDIASNSPTCIIRFLATSDYGSSAENTGLDNVRIVLPCTGTPAPGTATADNYSFCNNTNPLLTLAGYEQAGGIVFQWQSSLIGSPYAWTDISGATTPIYSAPAIFQTTYYRCVVRCVSEVSYSNVLTITNIAELITSTNSPVPVACNGTANLTATASGGTVTWYNVATGGSPVGTGNSYTTPVITANTTFYCDANSGSSTESGGMPANTGTYQSTSTNYGVVFTATKAFTLNSVTVYPNKKATLVIAYQNSSGVEQATKTFNNVTGDGLTPVVLSLGWPIPIGSDYRLVLKTYTPSTGTGLTYSSNASFPYASPSGALVVTSGWCSTYTTTYTNYHFYNLNISISCESSPRTPVQVNVTTGVTAPVCSTTPSPTSGSNGICPVGLSLSWAASNTACRAATGYRLYIGTDNPGTNLYNGLDVGNVLSYTLPLLAGSTTYNWKIVPYNTAGPATGCTQWTFSTAADPGDICTASLGSGVVTVGSLPYTHNNGTTSGTGDDLTSSNLVSCGSTSYFTGEDKVWVFTPAVSGTITITLTSSGTYTGLALYEGCPLSGSTCGASAGYCVGTAQSSTGDKTMTACVTAGLKYYLILDSYASPTFNPYSKLSISAPTGTTTPANDLPCNAVPLTMGVTVNGNNACAGAANEPATPTCWSSGTVNSVWYKVVATSTQLSVRTTTGTLTDTQIGLFSGTCGSGLVAVAGTCNNDQTGCGTNLSSQFTVNGLTPGNTYYIVVDGAYDLQGSFSILAIDPATMTYPLVAGQDCQAPLPTCNTTIFIPDPGYANVGSNCDFTGEDNCTGGERASLYYTIVIQNAGNLKFDIIPNDYDGTEGSETDYDYLVWKISGSGTLADCQSLWDNSAQGLVACNYSYLGVTGLYPGGGGNPDYEGGTPWDAAYEDVVPAQAGDIFLICISNYTQSTSGFTIYYDVTSPGTATINTSAVPTVLYWTGATSTAWTTTGNWGGCSIPSCATSAVINQTSRDPIISSNVSVNDLTINSGATLTINAGCKLQVCGNLINNGTLIANGTIEFISPDAQTYTNPSTLPLTHVIMNQPTPTSLTLFSNMLISTTGTLTLTSGKIVTGTNMVQVNNTAVGSVTAGNTTSYIEGNLRRYILSTGSYNFPVGHAAKGYQRATVNFTSATTISYLTAFFTPYTPLPTVSLTECSTTYNLAIDNGFWTINPNGNDLSGRYTMTLYNSNYTNSGSTTAWTIMSNHGSGWGLLNGDGSTAACATGTLTAVSKANMNGFSDFGTAATTGPLPIELLTFTGKHTDGENILNWITATETNNDYFILEKSKDAVVFEKLAEVDGAGNSNYTLYYQQVDHNPYPLTYYKLKQVDFDGAYTYSDIIALEYGELKEPMIDIYPNPAIDNLIVDTKNLDCNVLDVEIFDVLGKSVMKTTLTNMMDDPKKLINISSLNYGCYYVRFGCNEFSMVKKFLRGYK